LPQRPNVGPSVADAESYLNTPLKDDFWDELDAEFPEPTATPLTGGTILRKPPAPAKQPPWLYPLIGVGVTIPVVLLLFIAVRSSLTSSKPVAGASKSSAETRATGRPSDENAFDGSSGEHVDKGMGSVDEPRAAGPATRGATNSDKYGRTFAGFILFLVCWVTCTISFLIACGLCGETVPGCVSAIGISFVVTAGTIAVLFVFGGIAGQAAGFFTLALIVAVAAAIYSSQLGIAVRKGLVISTAQVGMVVGFSVVLGGMLSSPKASVDHGGSSPAGWEASPSGGRHPSPPSPSVGVVTPQPPPPPPQPRTYPSLPTALTEVPNWLIADSPFDVAEFLEVPPQHQNAAPLYLDALFEFSVLSDVFSPQEQQRREPIVWQREEEFWPLYKAWEKDPASVDEVALDAAVAEYAIGFEKLARAQQRPECVFQTGPYLNSLMGHAVGSRCVVRVVACRTWLDLKKGSIEPPIEGVETVLRLSRDLRPRGAWVSQLASISTDSMCYEQIVLAILTAAGIGVEHCDELLAVLSEHETEAIDPFLAGLRAEYVMMRFFLHDLEHRTGQFGAPRGLDDRLLAASALYMFGDNPKTLDDPKMLEHVAKFVAPMDYPKERDLLDRFYHAAAGLSAVTSSQRQRAFTDVEQIIEEARQDKRLMVMLFLAVPSVSEAIIRAETRHRGTACLIALRRWQLEHDTLPPDLATVVKAAGMEDVPVDPYSDRPFKMTVIKGRPVIYSVGYDRKDDRGLLEWEGDPDKPGDFLFRLEEINQ